MPYKQAIASLCLGRAWVHKLPKKLDEAKRFGYKGIELFYEDLEYFARDIDEKARDVNEKVSPKSLIEASKLVRRLCDDRNLEIIALQPFMHYEGLKDRQRHLERIEEMKTWIQLAKVLGTDLIEIPSTFLPKDELDPELMVPDLQKIADMGLKEDPPIKFAYESLAWGTYVDTWEKCYDIVQKVNRKNFGVALDTYNIAARVYADPTAPSGTTPNAKSAIESSLQRMKETVDPTKIFIVQLVDGQRLQHPLVKGHELYNPEQAARQSWSRNCRLFYGEEALGAYLPIREIASVILNDLGYDGWVSAELFNVVLTHKESNIPEELARRGQMSWKKFVNDLNLIIA
jgi:4-hydroxyphenylpyruvate dioxygenase